MSVGDIAGLVAATAFVLLVGFLALPLIKLGKVLDETRDSVKEITAHTIPLLDESVTTVSQTNAQLEKVDTVTTAAAEVSENVSALTALFSATIGSPMIKLAAFTYSVRSAMSRKDKSGRKAKG